MKSFELTYKSFGNTTVLVEWPQIISDEILLDIRRFSKIILNKNIKGIIDVSFVYASMSVTFNPKYFSFDKLKDSLKIFYNEAHSEDTSRVKLWEIPVCYDSNFGFDLNEMADVLKMSVNSIINYHSQVDYTIFGIGFLPGFLYLGGLNERIHFPRKEVPRLNVPKGAVGIAGIQTGIYPKESPGGWNIIGRCPVSTFNITQDPPCVFTPGDKVRFRGISSIEYEELTKMESKRVFKFKTIGHD